MYASCQELRESHERVGDSGRFDGIVRRERDREPFFREDVPGPGLKGRPRNQGLIRNWEVHRDQVRQSRGNVPLLGTNGRAR